MDHKFKQRKVKVFIESEEGLTPIQFVNRFELAEILGVSVGTIDYWNHRNEIPVIYFGKHPMFIASEVINHFQKRPLRKRSLAIHYSLG